MCPFSDSPDSPNSQDSPTFTSREHTISNALYDSGREGFLDGTIDWDSATIKVALVRGYTFNAGHKFVSDVTGASGVLAATSAALSSKTVTGGVADAADITFSSVASSVSSHSLLIFQSSAVTGGADVAPSAQRLIAWIDTGTNLPVVPNGGDVSVAFDSGANRIFKL